MPGGVVFADWAAGQPRCSRARAERSSSRWRRGAARAVLLLPVSCGFRRVSRVHARWGAARRENRGAASQMLRMRSGPTQCLRCCRQATKRGYYRWGVAHARCGARACPLLLPGGRNAVLQMFHRSPVLRLLPRCWPGGQGQKQPPWLSGAEAMNVVVWAASGSNAERFKSCNPQ